MRATYLPAPFENIGLLIISDREHRCMLEVLSGRRWPPCTYLLTFIAHWPDPEWGSVKWVQVKCTPVSAFYTSSCLLFRVYLYLLAL